MNAYFIALFLLISFFLNAQQRFCVSINKRGVPVSLRNSSSGGTIIKFPLGISSTLETFKKYSLGLGYFLPIVKNKYNLGAKIYMSNNNICEYYFRGIPSPPTKNIKRVNVDFLFVAETKLNIFEKFANNIYILGGFGVFNIGAKMESVPIVGGMQSKFNFSYLAPKIGLKMEVKKVFVSICAYNTPDIDFQRTLALSMELGIGYTFISKKKKH